MVYYVRIIEKGCFIFVITEKLKLRSVIKKLKFNVNVLLAIKFLTHEFASWTLLSPQYGKRNQMVTTGL